MTEQGPRLSKRAANYLAWIAANPGEPAPIQQGTREAVTLRGLEKRGLVTIRDGRVYPSGSSGSEGER